MTETQSNALKSIHDKQASVSGDLIQYWWDYSAFDTWQYWLLIVVFFVPLVVLFIKIDRSRALHLGFYGLNIHLWSAYFDSFGTRNGFWSYPYQTLPLLPLQFGLDSSLIPVAFILVYQWTIHKRKNYYLYGISLALIFTFILKPIMIWSNFFQFHYGANLFHLLLSYLFVMLLSKLITDLFVKMETTSGT
ncbi:hypothetical protein GJU40_15925 [Bacillus lacus]|uniref:Uncharacterized protein n=1 Tax=Metabacillus lacus TaxID=1983721 RepID=A0A7X2J1X6_9BACI|nr:CBO0543 family protein [Metabacillus lacus]MRX73632.1 hypothetical protein [Metabacillus lacus]